MTPPNRRLRTGTSHVEQIPITWAMPEPGAGRRGLVIWLPPGLSGMEAVQPDLERLAAAGFVAVSFDSWERGSRATEAPATLQQRGRENWPLVAWPILGHGALEVLRVMDWAVRSFDVAPPFSLGGVSLGGDLAVAAAGLDPRVGCVAAVVATPDWTRAGSRVEGAPVAAGEPDAYARFFYDRIDPLTNPRSYAHRPAMTFECGADDDLVPPDGALRFQRALADVDGEMRGRVRVNLHPGVGRAVVPAMIDACVAWFEAHG